MFKSKDYVAEDDTFSAEEGDVLEMPSVDASIVGRSFHLSDGEEDEAVVADEDILSDGDKEADNLAAVEAADARLANSAAAGSAAVAAAGASEVASATAEVSQPQNVTVCCAWQSKRWFAQCCPSASAQAIWPAQFESNETSYAT